jgi:Mitochondrial carrier protein
MGGRDDDENDVDYTQSNESNATGATVSSLTTPTTTSSTIVLICNASASALASIISRLCTHPFDTIKARIQIANTTTTTNSNQNHSSAHTNTTTQTTIRNRLQYPSHNKYYYYLTNSGITSLYRGLGVVIIGGTPGTMLYLCTYDIMKQQLSHLSLPPRGPNHDRTTTNHNANFLIHFVSGMIAETIACIVYVPVDVIKERMQVQELQQQNPSINSSTNYNSYYRNTYDAMRQILQTEGIRGIYRGYGATLASFGPFSALYFVFYEYFKNYIHASLSLQSLPGSNTTKSVSSHYVEIPFHWTVACAASAGGLASFLTSPLDMAKLRLQVQRGNSINTNHRIIPSALGTTTPVIQYTGMMDCLQKVYRQNGMSGLFRGAGARVLHFAPATTVTMTTYETLRQQFEVYLIQPHHEQ